MGAGTNRADCLPISNRPRRPDDDWDVDDPDLTHDASWDLEEFDDEEEPEPEHGDFWRDDDFDD